MKIKNPKIKKYRADFQKEAVTRWLRWLAHQMKSRHNTVFLLEELEANWLPIMNAKV